MSFGLIVILIVAAGTALLIFWPQKKRKPARKRATASKVGIIMGGRVMYAGKMISFDEADARRLTLKFPEKKQGKKRKLREKLFW